MTSRGASHESSLEGKTREPHESGRRPPRARGAATVRDAVLALQRSAGNGAVARVVGSALDDGVRAEMEERLGADLGHVRVNSDDRAAGRARSEGALAFTRGPEISFAEGMYRPASEAGRIVLAHELAHVVQQTRNAGQPVLSSPQLEAAADSAAVGSGAVAGAAANGAVQRLLDSAGSQADNPGSSQEEELRRLGLYVVGLSQGGWRVTMQERSAAPSTAATEKGQAARPGSPLPKVRRAPRAGAKRPAAPKRSPQPPPEKVPYADFDPTVPIPKEDEPPVATDEIERIRAAIVPALKRRTGSSRAEEVDRRGGYEARADEAH